MISTAYRALRYYGRADTLFKVHSPMVYNLAEILMDRNKQYNDFGLIEYQRDCLHKNTSLISRVDYGTGNSQNNKQATISSIAKKSLSKANECQAIYRLINLLNPQTVLELGTSLGISSAYMSLARPVSKMISLEGDPSLVKVATQVKNNLSLNNLNIIRGEFSDTLIPAIEELKTIDFAFIDGNHTYKATKEYFDILIPYLTNDSVLIFDDIHWSHGMERAWGEIIRHPMVTASLDMWHYGIVLFKKEILSPVHHTLIPISYKPWQVFYGI